MAHLLITVKAISPLYLGAFKPYGSFLETHLEISGALLRGAVVLNAMKDCAAPEFSNNHEDCGVKEDCPFYRLIPGVAFPICTPSESGHPAEPPLRTMVTCKSAPGFITETTLHEPKHGVFDMLIFHLAFNELQRLGSTPTRLPHQNCQSQNCNAPLEPFSRRYVRKKTARYHSSRFPKVRRMTHVAINRRRETAEQSLLYSVQFVESGAQFTGCIVVPDTWDQIQIEELKKLLSSIDRIGGEQTYGFGRVEIKVEEHEVSREDLLTRVKRFNEKLKEIWVEYAPNGAPREPPGEYITVDLLTPALLTKTDGTSTVQLTATALQERAAELGAGNLSNIKTVVYPDFSGSIRPLMFTGATIVSGWSEAWGLPKPPKLAATAGSVYVFHTPEISTCLDALSKIEAYGIGIRREEGFGAVRICDPFHMEVKPI